MFDWLKLSLVWGGRGRRGGIGTTHVKRKSDFGNPKPCDDMVASGAGRSLEAKDERAVRSNGDGLRTG